jgi:S1-C subfamily serine protease
VNTTSAKLAAGAAGNALLGVTIDPEYPAAAVIRMVTPGAPAEVAGLRPGDMIASINERLIQSPADVVNLVGGMRPGDGVNIQFVRPIPRSQVKAAAPEVQPGASAAPTSTAPLPPAPPAPPSTTGN